ncbi:hypothetical protein BBO_07004 [Beauveria brongniartii RCEF 3172]|uniref:Uncharacterized protein n=1 Tax=Beauveria brongniartii RCEF 3172 TaxID=1081107 RepID=A0A167AC30_9HYPO|nr:hypothetical protein BBO_07004 [Beauveria brongniartii RCEF 3172]
MASITHPEEAGIFTAPVATLAPKLSIGVGETRNGSECWEGFLENCQISIRTSPLSISSAEAERLWAYSEELEQKFTW